MVPSGQLTYEKPAGLPGLVGKLVNQLFPFHWSTHQPTCQLDFIHQVRLVIWQWLKIRVPNDPQEWSCLVGNHLFGVSIILSQIHICWKWCTLFSVASAMFSFARICTQVTEPDQTRANSTSKIPSNQARWWAHRWSRQLGFCSDRDCDSARPAQPYWWIEDKQHTCMKRKKWHSVLNKEKVYIYIYIAGKTYNYKIRSFRIFSLETGMEWYHSVQIWNRMDMDAIMPWWWWW